MYARTYARTCMENHHVRCNLLDKHSHTVALNRLAPIDSYSWQNSLVRIRSNNDYTEA